MSFGPSDKTPNSGFLVRIESISFYSIICTNHTARAHANLHLISKPGGRGKGRKYKYDGKVRGRIDEAEGNKVVEEVERERENPEMKREESSALGKNGKKRV